MPSSSDSSKQLPSHVSPKLDPLREPRKSVDGHRKLLGHGVNETDSPPSPVDRYDLDDPEKDAAALPPSLISPSFTPPSTPGLSTASASPALGPTAAPKARLPKSFPVDSSTLPPNGQPKLLEDLPHVNCVVRARIPTTNGQEMFLHLYENDSDGKEHLAIVFGDKIRSKSLDAPVDGETEMDRMTRGAYVGTLWPGRTSSGMVPENNANSKVNSNNTTALPSAKPISMADEPGFEDPTPPLVRIHSECYTGETVWSARCDCGEQLDEAARLMSLPATAGNKRQAVGLKFNPSASGGVIIYLRQEGRGIGLASKLKAYNLQDLGNDTVEANLILRHPADARSYGLATAMLLDLGLDGERGIRLLTNNPDKIRAVEGSNRVIRVKERVEMVPISWKTGGKSGFNSPEVGKYLQTKIERMGHMLEMGQTGNAQ